MGYGGGHRGGVHRAGGYGRRAGGYGRPAFRTARLRGVRRRAGFRRVGYWGRVRYRRYHHCGLLHNYFLGRRIYYNWGLRTGYYPIPFYETSEYLAQMRARNVAPRVETRQYRVKLVPYNASLVTVPAAIVTPGAVFQYAHPGTTNNYLIAGPTPPMPNRPVQLMLPPDGLLETNDRVNVLTNLGAALQQAPSHTIDTTGDGVPDATPFVPGRDAYISVMLEPGSNDRLLVHIPATGALTLKHIVDAIEAWGEARLDRITEADQFIIDSDFNVDLVQVGDAGAGPRWEHEKFVNTQIPVAPRVITVAIPENCGEGSIFVVGPELSGNSQPFHVRVPQGMKPGSPLEVVVPQDAAPVQVPTASQQNDDPNAWAAPAGIDFYAEAQRHGFQLTVGALEVTVRGTTSENVAANLGAVSAVARAQCCRIATFVLVFVVVLALIIGLSVGLRSGGGNAYVSGYNQQSCSSYYALATFCEQCPTTPVGETSTICWEDSSVTWASMSSSVQNDWTTIGYTQYAWDNSIIPSAADQCWNELSSDERSAAEDLGFNALLWNYPYRC